MTRPPKRAEPAAPTVQERTAEPAGWRWTGTGCRNGAGEHRWGSRLRVVGAVSVLVVMAACTGGGDEAEESESTNSPERGARPLDEWVEEWSEEPPVFPEGGSGGWCRMVAVGDHLVLLETTGDPYREGPQESTVSVRNVDGRWGEMPPPPHGGCVLAVGDSIAVATTDCTGEDCYGPPIGSVFDRRSGDWRPLDFPSDEPAEAAVPFDEGTGDLGIVQAQGWHSISESGQVTALPELPDDFLENLLCRVDDVFVQVSLADQWVDERRAIGNVARLDIAAPESGWTDGAAPPEGVQTGPFFLCGRSGPIFTTRDIETTYDVASDSWVVEPADLPATSQLHYSRVDDTTIADDGSLVARLDLLDTLFRRDPSGVWADLGLRGVDVYAVGDQFFFWSAEDPDRLAVLED